MSRMEMKLKRAIAIGLSVMQVLAGSAFGVYAAETVSETNEAAGSAAVAEAALDAPAEPQLSETAESIPAGVEAADFTDEEVFPDYQDPQEAGGLEAPVEEDLSDGDILIEDEDGEIGEELLSEDVWEETLFAEEPVTEEDQAFAEEAPDEISEETALMSADTEPGSDRVQVGTIEFRSRYYPYWSTDMSRDEYYYISSFGFMTNGAETVYKSTNWQEAQQETLVYTFPVYEDTTVEDLPQVYANFAYRYSDKTHMYHYGWVDQDGNEVPSVKSGSSNWKINLQQLPADDKKLVIYPDIREIRGRTWAVRVNNAAAGSVVTGYYNQPVSSMSTNREGYFTSAATAVANEHFHFDHWELNGERVVFSENEDEKNVIPTTYQMPADWSSINETYILAVFEPDEGYEDELITVTYKVKDVGKLKLRSDFYAAEQDEITVRMLQGGTLPAVTPITPSDYIFDHWETEDGTVLWQHVKEYYAPGVDEMYMDKSLYHEAIEPYLPGPGGSMTVYGVFIPTREVRVETMSKYPETGRPRFENYEWGKDLHHGYNVAMYTNAYGWISWLLHPDPAEGFHVDYYEWQDEATGRVIRFEEVPGAAMFEEPWRWVPEEFGDKVRLYVYYAPDDEVAATVGTVDFEADEGGALQDPSGGNQITKSLRQYLQNGAGAQSVSAVLHPTAHNGVAVPGDYHFLEWRDESGQMFTRELVLNAPFPGEGKSAKYTAVYEKDPAQAEYTYEVSPYGSGSIYLSGAYTSWQNGGSRPADQNGQTITKRNFNSLGVNEPTIAVPAEGYRFVKWLVNGSLEETAQTISNSNNLQLGQEKNVITAVFEPVDASAMGTVVFRADGNGKLQDGASQVSELTVQVLPTAEGARCEAAQVDGYHFVEWVDESGNLASENRIFTLPQNPAAGETKTFTAIFAKNESFTVELNVNSPAFGKLIQVGKPDTNLNGWKRQTNAQTGHITISIQAVPAAPAEGKTESDYVFDHWELNGKKLTHASDTITQNDTDVVVRENSVLMAVFALRDAEAAGVVRYSASAGGRVDTYEDIVAADPAARKLTGSTAKPDKGYELDGWYKGDTKVSEKAAFVPDLEEVVACLEKGEAVAYEARFKETLGTISGAAGDGSGASGSGTGSGSGSGGSGSAAGAEQSLAEVDAQILSTSSEEGPAGTEYGTLRLRAASSTKNSIKLKWNSVNGATGYVLYGSKCKAKFTRIGLVQGTSYAVKGLKKNTFYKYMVVAVKVSGNKQTVLAKSKAVHAATKGGKFGNPKKLAIRSKKKLALQKGKSAKIRTNITWTPGKQTKHRKAGFESSDPAVATVTAKGKVTAVGKGSCMIYVYAQNGLFKTVKVTVK